MAVTDDLIAGETIVFESKKHWMAPIRASLVAGLMVVGAWVLWLIAPGGGEGLFGSIGGFLGSLMNIAAVALLVGGVGWIVYNIILWRTALFAVTTMRVLREEGLASKRSSTTLLSGLSDVKSNISFVGSKLGYGNLVLLTTSGGAGQDRFVCITTPMEFRNAVMNQKVALGRDGGPAATPAPVAAGAAPPVTAPGAAPAEPPMTSNEAAAAIASLADLRDRGAITAEEFETKKSELLTRM